jgi:hypothetical protein
MQRRRGGEHAPGGIDVKSRALSSAVSLFRGKSSSAARLPLQKPPQQQQHQQQQQQPQAASARRPAAAAPATSAPRQAPARQQAPRRSAADEPCASHHSSSGAEEPAGERRLVPGSLQLQAASYLARSKARLEHMMGSSRGPAGEEAPAEQRLERPSRRAEHIISGAVSGSADDDAGAGLIMMMEQGDDSQPSSRQQHQQQQQQQQQHQQHQQHQQLLVASSRRRGAMPSSGPRATSISSGGSDGQQQQLMVESLQLSDDHAQLQRTAATFKQRPLAFAAGGAGAGAARHQQRSSSVVSAWSLDSLLQAEEADQQHALGPLDVEEDSLEQEALDSLFGSRLAAHPQLAALGGAAEALEQQALDSLFEAPRQSSRGMPWGLATAAAQQDDCFGTAARHQEPAAASRKRPRHFSSIDELFSEPAAGGAGTACGRRAQLAAQGDDEHGEYDDGSRGSCFRMGRAPGRMQRQGMQLGGSQQEEEQLDAAAGGQLFAGAAAAASPPRMARAAAFRWRQSPGGTGTALARTWGPAAGDGLLDDGEPGLGMAGGLLDRLTPLFKGSSWEVQHASATFTSSL